MPVYAGHCQFKYIKGFPSKCLTRHIQGSRRVMALSLSLNDAVWFSSAKRVLDIIREDRDGEKLESGQPPACRWLLISSVPPALFHRNPLIYDLQDDFFRIIATLVV